MDLNILWFILVAVLYIGFFVLEGFDFGVGMLLPFLGKNDTQRRVIINTIGPHWDGNEVWLLTAGGATFAAFPHWYATLFSGFYLALFLLLVGLIIRGVAFEFRSKDENPRWRSLWDWAIFIGSALPALLLGVAFANLMRGLPIDANMIYNEGLLYLLNPYSLLGGVLSVVTFLLHGALFLSLKTTDEMQAKARHAVGRVWGLAVVVFILFTVYTYLETDIVMQLGLNPGVIPIAAFVCLLTSGLLARQKREGWAFVMTSLTIVFTLVTFFTYSFPRVMISTLNPDWSLTIYNASSSDYTLTVMTVVALTFVPIILAYQGWTYWVFRKRVTADPQMLEY
ncbi:MAG: cytochrome d ubiquinol oxidase subunit II [Chloroflexi bacterium]|nr:MAG: cytochrome d ubiquinol oxidase subunit II [Chloroflexota bacterium]MBL1196454.1 cytochrome d ubiquinol oxidase subunit II [Chloroflexota bacterium]NOH13749.1 cytochrome d ubiquinol oxidase subunit II [Chloroflexota bacterium]